MSEFMQNFHFIRPFILMLLILPVFSIFFRHKTYSELSSWEEVCDKNLLQYLLVKGKNQKRRNLFWLVLIGFCSAIIAAAGPTWKQKEMPALYEQNPLIIALELSTDMDDIDKSADNLSRAKYIISDILQASPDTQSGMIVYTSEPFMVSPISEDYRIIENILPAIGINIMPSNGNRPDRAINLAADKLKKSGFSYGNILLITTDSGSNATKALDMAENAKNNGYKTSVIHISNKTNDLLKKITQIGGGIYLNLRNNPVEFSNFINHNFEKRSEESKNQISVWEDFGYYLLFLPMLCCLLLFRRGIFAFIAVFLAFSNAEAGFFLNSNQEGLKDFEAEKYEQAAKKFEDTNWQGSALYKAGKFEEALEKFNSDTSETGLYNQGNALAKSGKIEEAIKKYEQVLEINKDNEDAAFNLEYLKQQQENQQNQNSDGNDDNNKEDQKDNNSQSQAGGQDEQNQDENQQADASQSENQNQNEQNSGAQNKQTEPQKNEAGEQSQDNQQSESNADKGENSDSQPQKQEDTPRNEQGEQQNKTPDNPLPSAAPLQNQDQKTTSEEALAKAQQYRQIEQDPGGLLRAFIRAEYMKNRYKE